MRRLVCRLFGHDWRVYRYPYGIELVDCACIRCGVPYLIED